MSDVSSYRHPDQLTLSLNYNVRVADMDVEASLNT